MSDLVRLDHGYAPWKPSADAEMVVQYRYYDVPLAGVIVQGDREYLFRQLEHGDDALSLWLYTDITAVQRASLEESPATFDERFAQMAIEGWGRLALATDRLGIVDTEDTELDSDSRQLAMQRLVDRLQSLGQTAQEFVRP